MPLENPEGYGEQSSLCHFYSFVPTNSGEYPNFITTFTTTDLKKQAVFLKIIEENRFMAKGFFPRVFLLSTRLF